MRIDRYLEEQGLLYAGLGTHQVAGVCEGDPATVEQLVDVRGELQAVVAVEALSRALLVMPVRSEHCRLSPV